MMLWKRSTRAIVTGRKPKVREEIIAEAPETSAGPSQDGANRQKTIQEVYNMKQKKYPVWAAWAAAGGFLALLIVIILLYTLFSRPTGLPEVGSGQVIAAVQADTALSSAISSGDVVQLYSNGEPVPELQYVQVYQAGAGLLVLVDSRQAAVLASLENTQAVLVVHNDPEQAAGLLALQARINDPQVSLTVQSAAVLSPGQVLELETAAEIDPVEAVLPAILWTSSDPAVATVEDGIVTAQGVGQAEITASCGGVEAVCQVTVEIPLKEIHLSQTEAVLAIDETMQLTADADPADATGFAVVWSVEDSEIATVSEDGTVTAVAVGTTTVTASCGEISASCTVTVGVHAEMAQLDAQELTVAVGESASLTAAVYPSSGVIDKMIFESSDPEIAAVSEDGVVTGAARCTATISFRCGQATASCTVTVTAASS